MSKTKIGGYEITKDPFAPHSFFDDGGGGGGDLPAGNEGDILIYENGEWKPVEPPFATASEVAGLTDRVDAVAELYSGLEEEIAQDRTDIGKNADDISTLTRNLDAEAVTRKQADDALTARLDDAETDITNLKAETDTLSSQITEEARTRAEKDEELEQSVTDCIEEAADLRIDLNALDTAYKQADTELGVRIDTLETKTVPDGGTAGQVLTKLGPDNQQVYWGDVHSIPSGGVPGQVLKKVAAEDYAVAWADESGGGGGTFEIEEVTNIREANLCAADFTVNNPSRMSYIYLSSGWKETVIGSEITAEPLSGDYFGISNAASPFNDGVTKRMYTQKTGGGSSTSEYSFRFQIGAKIIRHAESSSGTNYKELLPFSVGQEQFYYSIGGYNNIVFDGGVYATTSYSSTEGGTVYYLRSVGGLNIGPTFSVSNIKYYKVTEVT